MGLCGVLLFLEFIVAFIVFPKTDRAKLPDNLEPEPSEKLKEDSQSILPLHTRA